MEPTGATPPMERKGTSSTLSNNDRISSSSSTSSHSRHFEPLKATKTREDVEFPIEDHERPEVLRVATLLSGLQSNSTAQTDGLQRQNTVVGMELNDPRFNPQHESFNFMLWMRKFLQMLEERGEKLRRSGYTFRNLNVSGVGAALQLQQTVGSSLMQPFRFREIFSHPPEKHILRDFNGHVNPGEMLIVLGRPGSGCSTFLKTICGELDGLKLSKDSSVKYSGVEQALFKKEFRGDVIYNQEQEKHFSHLTVGETLEFAAACRTPTHRIVDVTRKQWSKYMASVAMSLFGLSHTKNTKVGNGKKSITFRSFLQRAH